MYIDSDLKVFCGGKDFVYAKTVYQDLIGNRNIWINNNVL